jgi:Tol biopolymer transport system component
MPYEQQTIRSEALPAGEQKLLQAGKNGQIEITYRLQFEDGVEVGRSVLRRLVTKDPVDQITVVGVGGMIDSVQFPGTIAYVNDGNAWVMRNDSGGRQPVTSEGELDEHVFALSPDGSDLLYTVATDTVEFDGPFNDLYLLDIILVGEEPVKLPIQDVLWADWSPDGRSIAYSTGVKSGPPGWRAKNDLWVLSLFDQANRLDVGEPRPIQSAQNPGAYGWWGTEYAWSPDGLKIAYARADQVGWIDLTSRRAFPLAAFAPLNTHGDWVWVPTPTWSPDSWFVACTIHVDQPGGDPEESPNFEVWAFDIARQVRARLTSSPVGMWSSPRWSPAESADSQIAYAQAEAPLNSNDSRYALQVMDRDGSNERRVFPSEGETGIKQPIVHRWSPNARQIATLYLGDLYITDMMSGRTQRLTGDGQSTLLDWAR